MRDGPRPSPGTTTWWRSWGPALLLPAAVLLAYLPAFQNGWVNWDDWIYIRDSELMAAPDGLGRIWTGLEQRFDYPLYYPLTFTTWWLEYRIWGAWPPGHLAVNLALHALNAILVVTLARRLGLGRGAAWVVGALFALHPVQVASVAWLAERKNVLSGAFALLTMLLYVRQCRRGGAGRYALVLLLYALALLSKTAVMTLPASLFLLEITVLRGRWRAALVRTIPLFVLSAGAAAITVVKEYASPVYAVAWPLRPLAAAGAVWFYAGKLLLPVHILPVYPQWQVSATAATWWAALVGLLVAVVLAWRKRRVLGDAPTWGLAHFLITLSPVLGLVPFGYLMTSPVADHFVYLAAIGVFLALVTWAARLWARVAENPPWGHAIVAGVAVLLIALGVQTSRQTRGWHDGLTLFGTALQHDPTNPVLQRNLGRTYLRLGRPQDALPHYQAVVNLRPRDGAARCDLGGVLLALGRVLDAIAELHAATQLSPHDASAYQNLGVALAYDQRLADAEAALRRAAELSPRDAAVRLNLAEVLRMRGQPAAAQGEYEEALRLNPRDAKMCSLYAEALAEWGRASEAAEMAARGLDVARTTGPAELQRDLEQQVARFRARQ